MRYKFICVKEIIFYPFGQPTSTLSFQTVPPRWRPRPFEWVALQLYHDLKTEMWAFSKFSFSIRFNVLVDTFHSSLYQCSIIILVAGINISTIFNKQTYNILMSCVIKSKSLFSTIHCEILHYAIIWMYLKCYLWKLQ